MIYTARTIEENSICEAMELSIMSHFPLASHSHRLQAVKSNKRLCLAYLTTRSEQRLIQTYFDLEIEKDSCDMLGIQIEEPHRRQGNGKKLLDAIEEIAHYFDCQRILTVPSGQGIPFWKAMGFQPLRNSRIATAYKRV